MTRDALWKLRDRLMDRTGLYFRADVGGALMDPIKVEELLSDVMIAIDELIDLKDERHVQ